MCSNGSVCRRWSTVCALHYYVHSYMAADISSCTSAWLDFDGKYKNGKWLRARLQLISECLFSLLVGFCWSSSSMKRKSAKVKWRKPYENFSHPLDGWSSCLNFQAIPSSRHAMLYVKNREVRTENYKSRIKWNWFQIGHHYAHNNIPIRVTEQKIKKKSANALDAECMMVIYENWMGITMMRRISPGD